MNSATTQRKNKAAATPIPNDELRAGLLSVGLRGLEDQLDDFIARATRGRWPVVRVIEELSRLEAKDRGRRGVERRLRRSKLGSFKPIADFDWAWPTEIDRKAVDRVLGLDFIERAENVVLVASQGLGKTMIAKNIVHAAVMAGHSALFITASDLLLDMAKQETARALERRLRHYMRLRVLAIDEIGYLSYDNNAADLLFQIVTRRYEHKPIIMTTNLMFKEWNTVFPSATCATALIDRLTHHSEIIPIQGKSYRKREAEQEQKKRKRARRAKR
ncbi:MAG: AAA family ATPase [Deltaproteobacteria bacterium]|nr:MAG: AAA family ATPase [Deltaproteobacteria bacterium]